MKKILAALFLLLAGTAYAGDPVTINRSSFTKSNEAGYIPAAYLDHVIVGLVSSGGALVIYNSTYTTNAPVISSITLGTVFSYDYSNLAVAGIYYVTSSNANGVQIIYKK